MNAFASRPLLLGTLAVLLSVGAGHAQLGGKITELGSGGRSFNDARPDLAYDPATKVYAHVFEGGRAPRQIRLKLFDASTASAIAGGDVALTVGTTDNRQPRIAYIAKSGLFLVTWQSLTGGNNWDIQCRAYDPKTKTAGATLTVAASSAMEITPDIAGDATQADDDAIVVWDDEALGIRGVEVECPSLATVKVLTPRTLSPGAKPNNDNPTISRSGGGARRLALVYEQSSILLGIQAFTADLNAASTRTLLPLQGASFPSVDGDGTNFVVVLQRQETANPSTKDIWCFGLRAPGSANQAMTVSSTPRALVPVAGQDEMHPAIAFVGGSYLAAWSVVNSSDAFGRCRIQTLTSNCATCGTGWLVNRGGTQRTVEWNAVASEYNSDATTTARRARAMYDFGHMHSSGPRNLVQKVNFEVVGGPTATLAPGCGPGGTLSFATPVAFGESITPVLSGADSRAVISLGMIGLPGSRAQFPCGACRFVLGSISFPVPVQAGSARYFVPIPCDAALNNLELDFQYSVITFGTSPCPAVLDLSASNILRGTIR